MFQFSINGISSTHVIAAVAIPVIQLIFFVCLFLFPFQALVWVAQGHLLL